MQPSTRRQFLAALGTAAIGVLAGCNWNQGGDTSPAAGTGDSVEDWPMLGHDPGHSGYAVNESTPPADPEIQWEHDIPHAGGAPIVLEDTVVAMIGDGLRAYETETGDEHWRYTPDTSVETTPTIVDQYVYLATGHSGVHVLDVQTGDHVITVPLPGDVSGAPIPGPNNDRVYVGTDAGTVHAIPAEPGAPTWSADLFGEFHVAVAISHDGVFAATTGGEVYCLDPDDGGGRWRTKLPAPASGPPTVISRAVYVPLTDGSVYRLEGYQTGNVRWSSDRGGHVTGTLAAARGFVFGAHGSEVIALDRQTGIEQWSMQLAAVQSTQRSGVDHVGPLAIADQTLFAATKGGVLAALELDGPSGIDFLQFGGRKWTRHLEHGTGAGLAVSHEYVVTLGRGGEDESSRIVLLGDPE